MIKPIKDRVLVQLIEKKKVTDSGIILTSADPMEANHARVVAVGDEVTDVVAGDDVLIDWNKAIKTRVDLDDYYITLQENIILVFES
jgi:co-chaperonin GroES (HSP10)